MPKKNKSKRYKSIINPESNKINYNKIKIRSKSKSYNKTKCSKNVNNKPLLETNNLKNIKIEKIHPVLE